MLNKANSAMAGAVGIVLGSTMVDGGTTHIPAFILRFVLVIGIFGLWPRVKSTCHQWEILTPALALLSLMVGQAITPNIGLALQPSVTIIICIGIFIALLHSTENHAETLLKLGVAIGVAHAGWAMVQWVQGDARSSGGFYNPNNLAALLVPLITVAIYEAIQTVTKARWLWIFAGLFLTVGLLCSASRSGLIAMGAATSILLIQRFGKRGLIGIGILGSALGGFLVWRQLQLDSSDPYSLSRIAIWRESIALALEHPFGVGLGGYHRAMQAHGIQLEGWVRYPKLATQAHSELFQAWVEIGWLGLITILSCPLTVGLALRNCYKASKPIGRDLALFAAFSIPALASTTLHVPVLAALVSIWAAALFRKAKPIGPATTLTLGETRAPALGIGSAVALLLILPPAIGHHYRHQAISYRAAKNYAAASEAAVLASKLNPWSVANQLLKESLLFLRNGDPYTASRQIAELGAVFPKDPRPIDRAIWLLDQTKPQELSPTLKDKMKLQLLEELGNRTPKDALVWKRIAEIHFKRSDIENATTALDTCLKIEPHCSTCLAMKADLLYREGNFSEARLSARLAIEANEHAPKRVRNRHAQILSLSPKMRKIIKNISQ